LTRQLARARRLSAPAPAPADIITVAESQAAPAPKKRKRDILSDSSADEAFPAYAFPGVPPRPARFSNALKPPHASLAYAASRDGRLVYDGYPKAPRHLLGLAAPRTALAGVAGVADLRREHLPALKKLHAFCRNAAEALGVPCRVGYHAKPSLEPLHVHVVSVDLVSEFLKNKRHFASFATDRFVDASKVERALAAGTLADLLVSRDGDALACHRCGEAGANMPALKRHLAACAAPPPAAWDVIGGVRKRARENDDDDAAARPPAPEIIVLDETQDGDAAMAPPPPIRAGSPRDDALITPDAAAARTGPERFSVVTSESGRKPRRAPALSPRRAPAPSP
jgi:aprataxin